MENSNFIVRIPEPCHEDWNKMEPDAKGKFCNSCSKSVFDFSNKTDSEIKDILLEYKDQKVCGHFKKSQVNRPLNISISLKDLPRNISITKAFGIAIFIVFGTFLFSCTDNQGQKVGEIEIVDTKPEERILMGATTFSPPLDSITYVEMLSGDTMIEPIETISYSEEHVDGGISFVEMPYEEIVPVEVIKDSIVPEEPMMVGQMIMPYEERNIPVDSVKKDSTIKERVIKPENIDVIIKRGSFGIYPNPSNGEFTISYEVLQRANVRVDVYDLKGTLIRTVTDVNNQYHGKYQIPVNLNELPNGIYLVNLINGDKKLTERLVIER